MSETLGEVELFAGETKIGERTGDEESWRWEGALTGFHRVHARAAGAFSADVSLDVE